MRGIEIKYGGVRGIEREIGLTHVRGIERERGEIWRCERDRDGESLNTAM